MINSRHIRLFLIAAISSYIFPSHGIANCDYENTPISLKASSKPITEILKEIEKQANYSIQIDNPSVLQQSKSIEFHQTPLDLSLKRLLKNINYSVICDDNQKQLTLVLLDKGKSSGIASTQKISDAYPTEELEEYPTASSSFDNNTASSDSSEEEPKEMQGLSSALEQFYSNDNNSFSQMPKSEVTSMDAVTEAFEQQSNLDNNVKNSNIPDDSEDGEMAGISEAMNEYHNIDKTDSNMPVAEEPTTMDGLMSAMEELRRQKNDN